MRGFRHQKWTLVFIRITTIDLLSPQIQQVKADRTRWVDKLIFQEECSQVVVYLIVSSMGHYNISQRYKSKQYQYTYLKKISIVFLLVIKGITSYLILGWIEREDIHKSMDKVISKYISFQMSITILSQEDQIIPLQVQRDRPISNKEYYLTWGNLYTICIYLPTIAYIHLNRSSSRSLHTYTYLYNY